MVHWRSRELEFVFGGSLDASGITEASILRIADEKVPEGDQLDFKGVRNGDLPYSPSKGSRRAWTGEQEFAKDVGAFANHRGGVLLIGLSEANGVASSPTPVTASTPEAEEQRLRRALLNYSAPFIESAFVAVPASIGGWYLAVVVPRSHWAPHAVLDRADATSPLRYPVRHGRDTVWLTEHELAERYRRRMSAAQDEAQRVKEVIAEGRGALRGSRGVWLFAAAVPEAPVDARLDTAAVEGVDEWKHAQFASSPLGGSFAVGRGIPAPGRVTFTGRSWSEDDELTPTETYIELYVDGSAFAAKSVNPDLDKEWDYRLGDVGLADQMILLVDVILRWCAHQAGSYGRVRVAAGFVDGGSDDGSMTSPISFGFTSSGGPLRRAAGTRTVIGHPAAVISADLGAVETVQKRLAVTYLVLSALLQWFGVAEPPQLRPDGTIVCRQFELVRYREVEDWARRQDVNADLLREV